MYRGNERFEEEDDDPFGDQHVIETPNMTSDRKGGWLEL